MQTSASSTLLRDVKAVGSLTLGMLACVFRHVSCHFYAGSLHVTIQLPPTAASDQIVSVARQALQLQLHTRVFRPHAQALRIAFMTYRTACVLVCFTARRTVLQAAAFTADLPPRWSVHPSFVHGVRRPQSPVALPRNGKPCGNSLKRHFLGPAWHGSRRCHDTINDDQCGNCIVVSFVLCFVSCFTRRRQSLSSQMFHRPRTGSRKPEPTACVIARVQNREH